MPFHTALAMLKQPPRLTSITSSQALRSIRFIVPSRVMPALLTSDVDRPELALDLGDAGDAGVEIGDVPFIGLDAGALGEVAGLFLIAGIIGGDGDALVASAMLIASPMPLVPPVTIATRAMFLSFLCYGEALIAPARQPSSSRPISARSIAMPGALSLRQGR